jgi:hypothetical protein
MSIKVELGLAMVTALAGLGVLHTKNPLEPQAAVERMSTFVADDYAAFDRDFTLDGNTCKVGLERRQMCFTPSPLQASIIEGQAIPSNVPVLAAEFSILVELPVKQDGQKLLRYGTTLALIDDQSRIVEDVLYIDAATFSDAARAGQTELVTAAEDRTAG